MAARPGADCRRARVRPAPPHAVLADALVCAAALVDAAARRTPHVAAAALV